MDIKTFENKTPKFTLEDYFSGETFGQGQFYDRFGNVQLSFSVKLQGTFDGTNLKLDEVLTYDNGEVSSRTFDIKKINQNLYELRCPDIVGVGTIKSYGNALQWNYKLKQKIGTSLWTLRFDDWMFLKEGNLVLNRAKASKLGIELGEVFMVVSKK